MQKEKLGKIFVKAGLISEEQLAQAMQVSRKNPQEKLGRVLVRLNMASDDQVAGTLSRQSNIPYIDLNMVVVDPSAAKKIPADVAIKHHILPIYVEKNNLVLAVEDPYDFEAVEAARFASGLNIRPHVAAFNQILAGIKRFHSVDEANRARVQSATSDEELEFLLKHMKPNEEQLDELKKQAESPAIENMVNTIIFQAIAVRASEILLDPTQNQLIVKNRVEGELVESMKVQKHMREALVAHFKILAGMDFAKRLIPQKGRTQFKMQQRSLELEISSLPAQHGESLIIEVLDTGETVPVLNNLGLQSDDMMKVLKLFSVPQGMTLICGPPGSGKTTTLYALAHELSRHQRKIVTIEESIEYRLKGANQVQIHEATGLTFYKALQSVLLHKPDVVVLGEIRDKETADMAIKASQEGHLVLGVVRANTIPLAITGLLELGVAVEALTSALSGIITQRLVRKNCTKCREKYQPSLKLLQKVESRANEKLTCDFFRGKGCPACNLTGYDERFGVFHVVSMTQALERIIQQDIRKSSIGKIETTLLMKSILAKIKQGECTPEELKRVLFSPRKSQQIEIAKCQQCQRPVEDDQTLCPACQELQQQNTETEVKPAASPSQEITVPETADAPPPTPQHTPDSPLVTQAKSSPPPEAAAAKTADTAPAQEQEDSTPYKRFKDCKVLVVDSDQKTVLRVSRTLSEKQFTVITVADGQEALKKIVSEQPNLILTETILPKLNGLELIRKLRKAKTTTSIPVIIVSSKGETADRIKGFAAGSDDYVPKPFSMHELFFRINAVLRRTYTP